MFLLETLGGNCSLAFSSYLRSLAYGYLTPSSASVIISPVVLLTFPYPTDKDPCDDIAPTHLIRDNLSPSRPLTAGAMRCRVLRFPVSVICVLV